MKRSFVIALCALISLASPIAAQNAPEQGESKDGEALLLTIFLRHDQSKTLADIQAHMEKTRFYQEFPPPGTEVVSWVVAMGVGQIVTLKVPPDRLRAVNRFIEEKAWGAFRTEFYATYDFREIAKTLKAKP